MAAASSESAVSSMRDMLAPVRGPSKRAERGDGSILTSDYVSISLPCCSNLAGICARNQPVGQIVFSGLVDEMKNIFVVTKEKHNDVEIETYPSVYKAAYFMVQFAASLGVDVKTAVEKINDEKKRLIAFGEDKSKAYKIENLLLPIFDREGELLIAEENWKHWAGFYDRRRGQNQQCVW